MTRRAPLLAALAVGAMFSASCGSDREASVRTDSSKSENASKAEAQQAFNRKPRCERGFGLMHEVGDLGADLPGGDLTPEDSLTSYLVRDYSTRLTAASFTPIGDSRDAADPERRAVAFSYDDPDAGEIMLLTRYYGDSWYVTEASACEEVVSKESKM